MLTTAAVERILAALPNARVGLVGDLFLDRYLDIDPSLDEPSVETGLTAYQVVGVRSSPGALGTVMNNLSALGVGRIVPLTIIGDDGEGYELRQALARVRGVDASQVIVSAERRTPTYAKPMVAGRELNRLDLKNRTPTPAHLEDAVLARLPELIAGVDALIVLDQVSEENCGVVTTRVRGAICADRDLSPGPFVLADSRERIGEFRNVTVKPNEAECRRATGRTPGDFRQLGDAADALARQVCGPVFCTVGAGGIWYSTGRDRSLRAIAGYPVSGPIDVCGAGDSCTAGIVAARMAGLDDYDAAQFANLVASVTVRQLGTTGTATPAQVRARWAEVTGAAG